MNLSTHISFTAALLRPHNVEDKTAFTSTPRETEFYRMLGSSTPVAWTCEEKGEDWFQKKSKSMYSWAIEVDGMCVGSVWIHSIESANRRGRFAIEIFNKAYRGKGIGTQLTKAVMKVAFEELCLHRLDLRVLSINEFAIRCYEHCGFKREGIQRDTLLLDGV